MKIGDIVMHVRDPNGLVGIVYAWGIHKGNPVKTWVRVMWSHAEGGRSYHPVRDLEVVT